MTNLSVCFLRLLLLAIGFIVIDSYSIIVGTPCRFATRLIYNVSIKTRESRLYRVESNTIESSSSDDASGIETAWRYIKKPLLSIGSKGINMSHGNSLRELLNAHQVVKVKINVPNFSSSVSNAFHQLASYAVQNGAPEGIELIHTRESDRIILIGLPGTLQQIRQGNFPPQSESKE